MSYKDMFTAGKTLEGLGGSLVEQFGIPPFSVLDARSGAWQDRKAAWLSLGIKSELGRGENLIKRSDQELSFYREEGYERVYEKEARARAAKASPGGSQRPAADSRKPGAGGTG